MSDALIVLACGAAGAVVLAFGILAIIERRRSG
jgi:hypothetical protein